MEKEIRRSEISVRSTAEEKGYIITDACMGCGTCKKVCPQQCIDEGKIYCIRPNNCLHCGNCYENCPVKAIHVFNDAGETYDIHT
jgi:ferredoxin